ncbi:uncharacterized protein METZ01_LOCUS136560 [marine metagenome]|uniref:Uncharacterized protein n=1 Tax=marine metagenome TaxID=408172 RepID=A0A381Z337_9ZZZZ
MDQDWPTFIVKATERVYQIGLVGDVSAFYVHFSPDKLTTKAAGEWKQF